MNLTQNRRSFLKTALAAAAALPARITALAPDVATSKINDSALTVIDTHTHFYDPQRPQGVPWPPKDDPLLYRTVLPKEYRALKTPVPVTGTVVVEASSWIEDNQWILNLAANDPFIVGFVGNLPVGTDAFAKHLGRFAQNRLFRGIRIGGDLLKQNLGEQRFLADLKQLARRDLALDLLGGPELLTGASRLTREIPDLRIIIDHLAGVHIDGRAPDAEWKRAMEMAAEHPLICCKVSGLVEGTGRTDGTAPRDVAFYAPALDVVWNAFGEDRLIYGSNWPVSARFADLATVQQIVLDYFSAKRSPVLKKIFAGNAKRIYKWISR